MNKTPVKVYEDKDIFRTPHSGLKRVLNLTPGSQPLSPKDTNVQTPLIFKPKKIQIPEIFSPIAKLRNLQTRKKYTISNDENYDNFEANEGQYKSDAVTSTPIVPRRNRNYTNLINITPKPERNGRIFEKKTPLGKVQNLKSGGKINFTDGIDTYRRNNLKHNLTNELKAVLQVKQLKNGGPKQTIGQPIVAARDKKSKESKEKSDSFEEIKARFEKVKSQAVFVTSPNPRVKNSKELVIKRNSFNSKSPSIQNSEAAMIKTNKSISFGTSGISLLESSTQQSGSNLNYYTAFPDPTNPEEPSKVGKDLVCKSNDKRVETKTSKVLGSTEKLVSRIPKRNIGSCNKREARSILIRDEDIDRITYRMNLGKTRRLTSTSKEKTTFGGENIDKTKKLDSRQNEPKMKLAVQNSQYNERINKSKEMVHNCNKNITPSHPAKTDSKVTSLSKIKTSSFKITKKNISDSEIINKSKSHGTILNRKRKTYSLEKVAESTKNTNFRFSSEYIVKTRCNKVPKIDPSSCVEDFTNQNVKNPSKQITQTFDSLNTFLSDKENNSSICLPDKLGNQNVVNSTFVVQSSNSHDCNFSPLKKNPFCQYCSTRDKFVKSSLEALGECFKFRRKSTLCCTRNTDSGSRNQLKRSFSFVHVRVKGSQFEKSFLDIKSFPHSFPQNYFSFTEKESCLTDPNIPLPKRSKKKRKQLKPLTTELHHPPISKEEINDKFKETEEIYKPGVTEDIIVDVHAPHTREQEVSNIHHANIHPLSNATANPPEKFYAVKQNLENDKEKIKTTDLEIEINQEKQCKVQMNMTGKFLNTERPIKKRNVLEEIVMGVEKVEQNLDIVAKLNSELKDDLVVTWVAKSSKSSSSSDSISHRNVSVKDDYDAKCKPLRNLDNREHTEKLQKLELNLEDVKPASTDSNNIQCRDDAPYNAVTPIPGVEPHGVEPAEIQSKYEGTSVPTNPPPDTEVYLPPKSPRLSLPVKLDEKDVQYEEYRIYLEERNYLAIQTLENRLSRVEERLDSLTSITLDIRNLLRHKEAEERPNCGEPASDVKATTSAEPPPPPPLPSAPLFTPEVFFFPLRSSSSHNSSFNRARRRSPRAKSLRPAITVDDLRSVTLRKVARAQQMKELTAAC